MEEYMLLTNYLDRERNNINNELNINENIIWFKTIYR